MLQWLFGAPVKEVSAEEAAARKKAGAILVDVRETGEWKSGHIAGAIHIPLGQLSRRAGEIDRTREVIAVCLSGSRSASAARSLEKLGFANVSSLAGGMSAWQRRGLPIAR